MLVSTSLTYLIVGSVSSRQGESQIGHLDEDCQAYGRFRRNKQPGRVNLVPGMKTARGTLPVGKC